MPFSVWPEFRPVFSSACLRDSGHGRRCCRARSLHACRRCPTSSVRFAPMRISDRLHFRHAGVAIRCVSRSLYGSLAAVVARSAAARAPSHVHAPRACRDRGPLCMLAVYALYFRNPGGRLAAHDAYALRTFANFYVTVPAVLAALARLLLTRGAPSGAIRRFSRRPPSSPSSSSTRSASSRNTSGQRAASFP